MRDTVITLFDDSANLFDDWTLIRQLAKKLQDERRNIKRGESDE